MLGGWLACSAPLGLFPRHPDSSGWLLEAGSCVLPPCSWSVLPKGIMGADVRLWVQRVPRGSLGWHLLLPYREQGMKTGRLRDNAQFQLCHPWCHLGSCHLGSYLSPWATSPSWPQRRHLSNEQVRLLEEAALRICPLRASGFPRPRMSLESCLVCLEPLFQAA